LIRGGARRTPKAQRIFLAGVRGLARMGSMREQIAILTEGEERVERGGAWRGKR